MYLLGKLTSIIGNFSNYIFPQYLEVFYYILPMAEYRAKIADFTNRQKQKEK